MKPRYFRIWFRDGQCISGGPYKYTLIEWIKAACISCVQAEQDVVKAEEIDLLGEQK